MRPHFDSPISERTVLLSHLINHLKVSATPLRTHDLDRWPDAAMSASTTTEAVPPDVYEWQPAELIRRVTQHPSQNRNHHEPGPGDFALIVLNQPLPAHLNVIRNLWRNGAFSSCRLPSDTYV